MKIRHNRFGNIYGRKILISLILAKINIFPVHDKDTQGQLTYRLLDNFRKQKISETPVIAKLNIKHFFTLKC